MRNCVQYFFLPKGSTYSYALLIRLQKTSSRRLGQDQYIRLDLTSSRHLPDSSRRFEDVSSS